MQLLRNSTLKVLCILLLLISSCRKTDFETTGKLVIKFQQAIPSCYALYTEVSYSTNKTPLIDNIGRRPGGIRVTAKDGILTFEGLNYGNYILETCPNGNRLVVQVAANETREYVF